MYALQYINMCCVDLPCLFVCLTLLASFFLPSHLSLKYVYIHVHMYVHLSGLWLGRLHHLSFLSMYFLKASVLCTCISMYNVMYYYAHSAHMLK